jgi:iron(III) transport system ATP-binding protein
MNDMLVVDQISVAYRAHGKRGQHDKQVLDRLSFRLAEGEIGCLLGASGCGKTTALRALAGFEPLCAGRITLADVTMADLNEHLPPQQRNIGMMFQDYALFPHLNVADNVGFGLRHLNAAARKARVEQLLNVVGLSGHEKHQIHALSGGQQQRVALARALAPMPRLILLDEPFSNLDVELRERLSHEVRNILKAQGTTALLVTHDQHEAFAIADRIGVMDQGCLRQWDSAYALYHQPVDRFVADFVGEGVFLPGVVSATHEIEFELGRCPSQCITAYPTGQRVQVLLRPDDVLHDDGSALQARVVKKVFRGAYFLYTLALPSGQTLLSLVPSHHDHMIGEAIGIRLEIDHVIAFADARPASY